MASESGTRAVQIESKVLRFAIALVGIASIGLAVRSLFQANAPDITSTAFVIMGLIALWIASIGFIPGITELGGVKVTGALEIVDAVQRGDEEKLGELLEASGASHSEINEVQVRAQPPFTRRILDQIENVAGVTVQRAASVTRDNARNVVISGTFTFRGKRVAVDSDQSLSGARATYPVTRLRVALTHSDHFDLALLVVPDDLRAKAESLVQQDVAQGGPLPGLEVLTEGELTELPRKLPVWLGM